MITASSARALGLALVVAGMASVPVAHAADTTEAWRYDFGSNTNDGHYPALNGLVLASDGNYYGTASSGGASNLGTIFRVTPGGTLTVVHSFAGGAEGCTPTGGLSLNSNGALVGLASGCGASGAGTIFRSSLNGNVVVLHTFTSSTEGYNGTNCSGKAPILRASDGDFLGTNCYGGPFSYGTVWQLAPNGRFTVLHYFNQTYGDGLYGIDIALAADETIYGITNQGGVGNNGTLYKIDPTSGAYSTLYNWTNQGHDGNQPTGIAIGPDGGIYGNTYYGGLFNQGVVFQYLKGKYKVLHNQACCTLKEGTNPFSKPVIDANGNIWASTYGNGGALFMATPKGTYSTMYIFGGTGDGNAPDGAAVLAGGTDIFMSTRYGGANNLGTIERMSLGSTPTVTLTAKPTNPHPGDAVTLTWKGSGVNTCTASSNAGGWSGTQATSGQTAVTAPNGYGHFYYWIGCSTTSGNANSSQTVEITVGP